MDRKNIFTQFSSFGKRKQKEHFYEFFPSQLVCLLRPAAFATAVRGTAHLHQEGLMLLEYYICMHFQMSL